MKIALFLVNLLLAVWLLTSVSKRFAREGVEETLTVKAYDPKKGTAMESEKTEKTVPAESVDSLLATILDNNIFNSDRCPNALFGRGRSNRVELSLVGTFEIGECKGAIILQKSASDLRNFPGIRGGGPAGPDGAPRPPWTQGGAPGAESPRLGAWNRAGANGEENRDSSAQIGALRQYVRLGETLANGYTLTAITRTGAVLVRGSDKMELELQDPSRNLTQVSTQRNDNRRGGFFQQMQQMQQMQIMQNFQMMRMMRNTMWGQNRNGNPGGNRGGSPGGAPPGR